MFRIAWQTLRSRRGTLAGAFIATLLAVTFAYATGQLMAGALSAPGPGRFAAADAVVRADPSVTLGKGENAFDVDAIPGPRLPAATLARVAAVPGVARVVGDVAVPVGVFDARGRAVGGSDVDNPVAHGWPSAALTPYRLRDGRVPQGASQVVADSRFQVPAGALLNVVTPAGEQRYRVTGVADPRGAVGDGQAAIFFTPAVARAMSGEPNQVNAIGVIAAPGTSPAALQAQLRDRLGTSVEILDTDNAAKADAGDAHAADRVGLIAIFGTMGGIAGAVALFVVTGALGLAVAQRRRETAVLRALGASPSQVRRLIAAESLIVSLVAGALGILLGGPLADTLAGAVADNGIAPLDFEPGESWVPLVAAFGMGIVLTQLAVVAAARRAGRIAPAEALREVAIEHPRPGLLRVLTGILFLGGGVAIAIIFQGELAMAFAVLSGLALAIGIGLLGPWILGISTAVLAAPLRWMGAPGLLASMNVAANRWRSAALGMPVVLILVLAGSQAVTQISDHRNAEHVTGARTTAHHVVAGADGAPLPRGTADRLAGLPGVDTVTSVLPMPIYLLGGGLDDDDSWRGAGVSVAGLSQTLDLKVVRGSLDDLGDRSAGISRVVASKGHLEVGDVIPARLADTTPASLRVAAIYDRAAGLGDVVLDADFARRHAASPTDGTLFVQGGPDGERSVARYAATHSGVSDLSRSQYLDTIEAANQDEAYGIWLIIALAAVFATLALLNTAAMATGERRAELATIRLLGGTKAQITRMITLELLPTTLAAAIAGAGVVALSVMGVPHGVTGIPLSVPVALAASALGAVALLTLAAGAVTARLALRVPPAAAMRAEE